MTDFSKRFGDVLGQAVENKLETDILSSVLPTHVACIMDGNRRHADSKLIPTALGHREGKEKLEDVMDWILDLDIKYLTVYALSTENIQTRSGKELNDLVGDDKCNCPIRKGLINWTGITDCPSQQEICDKGEKLLALI